MDGARADPKSWPAVSVQIIEHQEPLQPVAVEKAQEVAPLLGREGRVNRVASSEPNTAMKQANALCEVCHHVT
jgi:hypothetical protein